jgi:CRP/FNR family transcriptional regulator, cyclic AMP receptor protein
MEILEKQYQRHAQGCRPGVDIPNANAIFNAIVESTTIPVLPFFGRRWNDVGAEWRVGDFFKDLSPEAMSEFESNTAPFSCEATAVVFTEEQEACYVLILLEGRVKLTMNSSEGKRLMLGIARPGEVLGLATAISGRPYESTAVAQFPCKIIALPRRTFLDFLQRYPVACQNSARILSVEYKRSCDQLRILGLTLAAPIKLAKLLLQWSVEGQRTEFGARIRCSLTHEEIGEYIGVSRETITRNLTDFKNHELLEQRGSTFLIPSLRALEDYAGIVSN